VAKLRLQTGTQRHQKDLQKRVIVTDGQPRKRIDKLGVTGSSPVPPTQKPAGNGGFPLSLELVAGDPRRSDAKNVERKTSSDAIKAAVTARTPGRDGALSRYERLAVSPHFRQDAVYHAIRWLVA
jgi:hypothetical protein